MKFLHRPIALRILVNAFFIWLGLRFAAMIVGWGLGTSIPLAICIVALTVGLAVFDARRRGRRILLENLGISGMPIGILAACPPVVFESIWLWATRT